MRNLLTISLSLLLLSLAACRTSIAPAPVVMGSASDADAPKGAARQGPGPSKGCAPVGCAPVCPKPCKPCKLGCYQPSTCRNWYVEALGSFIPNVGVGIGGGRIFRRTTRQTWSWELSGVWQPLDDEDFVSDGNPSAKDLYQLRAGFKTSSHPRARRHFTKRFGAAWMEANGEPNIVSDPGDYFGVYGGLGFETDLSPSLTIGPEVSVMVLTAEDKFDIARPVPQFNWHLIWWLGGGRGACLKRAPYGELYGGATALFSPGFGGGLEVGQVFSRSSLATWSFEVLAGFEDPSDALFFNGEGKWAQIRGGAKATFQPCQRKHLTARAGAMWARSTAPNDFLGQTGDNVGAYLGAGYEWDIGRRFATGPELSLLVLAPEKGTSFDVVPQLNWHFLFKL